MAGGKSYAIRNLIFSQPEADRQDITFVGPKPEIRFEEEDQTDPAGRYRIVVTGDEWRIQRAASAEWGSFSDIFRVDGSVLTAAVNGDPDIQAAFTVFPKSDPPDVATITTGILSSLTTNIAVGTSVVTYRANRFVGHDLEASSATTITTATTVYIGAAPTPKANVTITNAYALWIDSGDSRFDGDLLIDGANAVKANTSTLIGLSVSDAALTVGSLGSLIVPVKGTTGAPNDAAFGDVDGAFGFNSQDNTLEVRDGTDTFLSVGVAGYVIQRSVPPIEDAWYHLSQRVHIAPGVERIDEAACVVCGKEMMVGEQVTMWANAHVRNQDLHAVFGHLHLDQNPEHQALKREVARLRQLVEEMQR